MCLGPTGHRTFSPKLRRTFLLRYLFKDSFSHLTFESLQINFFVHYFYDPIKFTGAVAESVKVRVD